MRWKPAQGIIQGYAATARRHPRARGLKAWYLFSEGSGLQALDSSGNLHHGTLSAPTWTHGQFGPALEFNGTTAYISCGTRLDHNGELTIAAWINSDTVASGTRQIVSNCDASGSQQDYTFELNRTAAKLSTVWGNTVILTGATSLVVNTWYHVALVRAGSSGNWTVKVYLNAVEDGSTTTSTNPNATNELTAIGRSGAFDIQKFDGKIDEVRIYTRALSIGELWSLRWFPFLEWEWAWRQRHGTLPAVPEGGLSLPVVYQHRRRLEVT